MRISVFKDPLIESQLCAGDRISKPKPICHRHNPFR